MSLFFAATLLPIYPLPLLIGRLAAECADLATPEARGFKRPYGWAWLLKLAAELTEPEPPFLRNKNGLRSSDDGQFPRQDRLPPFGTCR
jgi:hypothetical protein